MISETRLSTDWTALIWVYSHHLSWMDCPVLSNAFSFGFFFFLQLPLLLLKSPITDDLISTATSYTLMSRTRWSLEFYNMCKISYLQSTANRLPLYHVIKIKNCFESELCNDADYTTVLTVSRIWLVIISSAASEWYRLIMNRL